MPRDRKPGPIKGMRTDAQVQPLRAATHQPYGDAGDQLAAQRTVPLPQAPPVPTGAPITPDAVLGAPGAAPADPLAAALQSAQAWQPPMSVGLHAPTARPDEPITHGLAMGPGAGPEALGLNTPQPAVATTLADLARISGDPSLAMLAQQALGRGL